MLICKGLLRWYRLGKFRLGVYLAALQSASSHVFAANRAARDPFGLFELDLSAGELCKQDRRIKLQDQPFQVLVLLLRRPGEVVTREELQQALWPADTFVEFDQGLNTAIKKIRQALGDSADNPRFVETIPRKGYRFIAPVEGNHTPPRLQLWAVAGIGFGR